MQEGDGEVIGNALRRDQSLENLFVRSSDLGNKGMLDLLTGVKWNNSLRSLHIHNGYHYVLSKEIVKAIEDVVRNNTILKRIDLPNHSVEARHVAILILPYDMNDNYMAMYKGNSMVHRPVIQNLSLKGGSTLPEFNRSNLPLFEKYIKLYFNRKLLKEDIKKQLKHDAKINAVLDRGVLRFFVEMQLGAMRDQPSSDIKNNKNP